MRLWILAFMIVAFSTASALTMAEEQKADKTLPKTGKIINISDLKPKQSSSDKQPVVKPKEAKKDIPTKVEVNKDVSIGIIEPIKKDPRIYTEKEIQKHKDSPSGSETIGVKIKYSD